MRIISDDGVSKVWRGGSLIYKNQPKFMTDNELWILDKLQPYGFTPVAVQVDTETIIMEYLEPDPLQSFNFGDLRNQADNILYVLKREGIRHGDLTEKNLIVSKGRLYVIDFAESRLATDPRPDKRPEGDSHWIHYTIALWEKTLTQKRS